MGAERRHTVGRRQVIAAAAGLAAGGAVAGCTPPPPPPPSPAPPTTDPADSQVAHPTASGSAGTKLGPASDVPVGGGTVFESLEVVVTQPTPGRFVGLTAVCT